MIAFPIRPTAWQPFGSLAKTKYYFESLIMEGEQRSEKYMQQPILSRKKTDLECLHCSQKALS
jgi:hypothetical protein